MLPTSCPFGHSLFGHIIASSKLSALLCSCLYICDHCSFSHGGSHQFATMGPNLATMILSAAAAAPKYSVTIHRRSAVAAAAAAAAAAAVAAAGSLNVTARHCCLHGHLAMRAAATIPPPSNSR